MRSAESTKELIIYRKRWIIAVCSLVLMAAGGAYLVFGRTTTVEGYVVPVVPSDGHGTTLDGFVHNFN